MILMILFLYLHTEMKMSAVTLFINKYKKYRYQNKKHRNFDNSGTCPPFYSEGTIKYQVYFEISQQQEGAFLLNFTALI